MSSREADCLTCGGPVHTTTASGDAFCVPCSSANERGWTEGYDRALLERDAAEVQRALDDESEDSWLTTWEAESCEAWLTRARVVLGR